MVTGGWPMVGTRARRLWQTEAGCVEWLRHSLVEQDQVRPARSRSTPGTLGASSARWGMVKGI